jgi:hypothetical protein
LNSIPIAGILCPNDAIIATHPDGTTCRLGAFLSTALYIDALTHLLGGEEAVRSGFHVTRRHFTWLAAISSLTPEIARDSTRQIKVTTSEISAVC